MNTPEVHGTRARVLVLLKRHGDCSTGFQILEPGYHYWFFGDEACVAYTDTGPAWVTAGAPVCDPARRAEVTGAFLDTARRARKAVRFFGVEEGFIAATGLKRTHIGEQPLWNPCHWADVLRGARSLREQLRRARAKGVRVRVVGSQEIGTPPAPAGAERSS